MANLNNSFYYRLEYIHFFHLLLLDDFLMLNLELKIIYFLNKNNYFQIYINNYKFANINISDFF